MIKFNPYLKCHIKSLTIYAAIKGLVLMMPAKKGHHKCKYLVDNFVYFILRQDMVHNNRVRKPSDQIKEMVRNNHISS